MPPPGNTQTLLSPAELSYLHSSLAASPPIRPDLRSPTQFRPLIAETGILPTTNGSARVCFSDGTEALVGVKAELEKTPRRFAAGTDDDDDDDDEDEDEDDEGDDDDVHMQDQASTTPGGAARTDPQWLEVSLDLPGHRDDDPLPVFLSAMIAESLLASGAALAPRLRLNARWHWKLYVDLLLLSAPLSYPLPLLSLATHLALRDTVLPRRVSDPQDDPLFDDDWQAGRALFDDAAARPPVTLLVATAGDNIVFDPSREEVAVADSVVAVSLAPRDGSPAAGLRVIAVRMVDPPARLTPPGVPNSASTAVAGAPGSDAGPVAANPDALSERERSVVWTPPQGGLKRALLSRILKAVTEPGGVGDQVLEGLANVSS